MILVVSVFWTLNRIEPDIPLHSDDVDALAQHELNLDEDPYEVEVDAHASKSLASLTHHKSQSFHRKSYRGSMRLQTKLRSNA